MSVLAFQRGPQCSDLININNFMKSQLVLCSLAPPQALYALVRLLLDGLYPVDNSTATFEIFTCFNASVIFCNLVLFFGRQKRGFAHMSKKIAYDNDGCNDNYDDDDYGNFDDNYDRND